MNNKGVITDLIRSLFFLIDKGIYWLVEITYQLFHEIAGLGLLGNESFQKFTGRIYLILGIFALFKIAFALIGMFVNPDSFSDSKTGGGKLVSKVATALILLTLVPTIFQLGYRLQGIVLENNVLPTIILGSSTNEEHAKETFENGGKMISTTIFKAFFRPYKDSEGNVDFGDCTECKTLYSEESSKVSVSEFGDVLNNPNNEKKYIFDYNILISSVAAGLTAFLLISFAFDVAIRSVKLTFLQLIAPIPIIMSIDPKKGTEGLKKWFSTTISTYLDLFLRLGIIYFVVYIMAEITKNGGNVFTLFKYDSLGNPVASNDIGLFATVFIIMGLLLFAKQAPQLIYDLLGIKPPSGGFGLNPLKKLSSVPLLGGIAGASAYAGAGMLTSGAKYGGSGLKAGYQVMRGQHDKASSTMTGANTRLMNRAGLAKQEFMGRFGANKFGGADKYSGTTLSGAESKLTSDKTTKKFEAVQDEREKKRMHDIGTSIVGTSQAPKNIDYIDRNDNKQQTTYDDIKKITNSNDMFAAYNKVYSNKDYASSMVNITHKKNELKQQKVDMQKALAVLRQNPNDQAALDEYTKISGKLEGTEATLKGYTENHEKLQAKHEEMAKIEKAIKVSKGPKVGENVSF